MTPYIFPNKSHRKFNQIGVMESRNENLFLEVSFCSLLVINEDITISIDVLLQILLEVSKMEPKNRLEVEKQFEIMQDAVLNLQKEFDIQAPGGPQAVRSCTSCLSNSCNQPPAIKATT